MTNGQTSEVLQHLCTSVPLLEIFIERRDEAAFKARSIPMFCF